MGKSVDENQLRRVLQFKLSSDPLLDSAKEKSKAIYIDLDDKVPLEKLANYVPEDISENSPYSGERFFEV